MGEKIKIQPISASSIGAGFTCGNISIEQKIKDSYFATILREGFCNEIRIKEQVVGYYMLKGVTLSADELPEEFHEIYSSVYSGRLNCPTFGAIELTYLAISKDVQGKHIGTEVLRYICDNTRALCKEWPIRFIVGNALNERVSFYKRAGFSCNDDLSKKNSDTVFMYLDCIGEEELQEISNHCCCD